MLAISIAISITIILCLVTIYYYNKKNYAKRVLFKTLTSTSYVFIGIFSIIFNTNVNIIYAGGILVALIFDLIGDMLLSLHPFYNDKEAKKINLAGILCFMLGHIMYIGVFIYFIGFNPVHILYILIIPILFLILIFTKVIKPKELTVPLIIYSIIISLIFIQGINFAIGKFIEPSSIIILGAILFIIANLTLALYNFSKINSKWLISVCLITYYTAQILFAYSISLF